MIAMTSVERCLLTRSASSYVTIVSTVFVLCIEEMEQDAPERIEEIEDQDAGKSDSIADTMLVVTR